MNRKIIFVFMLGIFLLSLPRADAVTELRTVEYFINNQSLQLADSAWWNSTFNFKLSDTSATIKSAYIEIYGSRQSGGTTDRSVSVYFNNTLLGTYTTESTQEGYLLHIVSNLTQEFYTGDPSTSSQWQLAFQNGATDLFGGVSAKLVVTYQYTGPPKTKTIRQFINSINASTAASGWQNITFPIKLNGTNPAVKSAFFEIYSVTIGTADTTLAIYLNNTRIGNPVIEGSAPSYGHFGMFNATGTTNPVGGIYSITDTSTKSYQLAFQCGAGNACEGIMAALVVTYESDAEAPVETSTFFINNQTAQVAAAGWSNQTFWITLSDTNPVVKSAYFVIRGMLPNTAPTIKVYLNNTLISTPAYTSTIEQANIMIFANASNSMNGLFLINDNSRRSYQLAIQCAAACEALSTDLVLTYEYTIPASDSTPPQWLQNLSNTSNPVPGGGVLLSANWTDGTELDWAFLETNETGTAENKTNGAAAYGSPIRVNLTGSNTWSNFTWVNPAIAGGTVVAWKIYANDTANNFNGTALSTFRVIQQLTQQATVSLTLNTQTQNLQSLFQIIKNTITATLQVDKASIALKLVGNSISSNAGVQILSNFLRVISNAITNNVAVQTLSSFFRTLNQAISTNIVSQSIGSFLRSISNVLTTNIVTGPLTNFFRIISNAVTTNSAADTIRGTIKLVSQAVTQNAAVQTTGSFLRTISNAITPNSITSSVSSILRPISQAITTNTAVTSASTFLKSISQAVTTNTAVKALTNFLRTISQAITTTSANQILGSFFKVISQAITENFATRTASSIFKSVSQAVTANPVASAVSNFLRFLSQTINENSSFSSLGSFLRSVSNTVTSNIFSQSFSSIFKTISQAITQNIVTQSVSSIFKIISQALSPASATKSISLFLKPVSQAIAQNIAVQTVSSFFKTISEAITQNSAVQTASGVLKFVSQAITQNSAVKTVYSIFRTISQAVTSNTIGNALSSIFKTISQTLTTNTIPQAANTFLKTISQAITQNAVAKSVSSLFKFITQTITENLSISKVSLFFKTIQQSISPTASGSAAWYHRFYIFVSQQISANMEAMFGVLRAPPSPTGPTVAVIYTSSGTGDHSGFIPKIKPSVPIKPPPTAAIQFVKQPALREVEKGQPLVEGVIVKNIGTKTIEGLEAEISGIDSKWFTVLPSSADLEPGEKTGFTLFITPPKDAQEGDYAVTITMKADGVSDKTAFIMRVKSFEPVADKAVVARAVSIDNEEQKSEVMLVVRNGPTKQENVKVTEVIKKEIASSADELVFSEQPEIIEKDPIVRWTIKELQPYETKNFTYTVKKVLQEYSPYVYWPTEELALPAISEVKDIRVLPLNPIELQPGKFVPVPIIIENIGNTTRNVSVTMRLPSGWELIPQIINETIAPNETKIFKFSVQIPRDEYPGYYVGKVTINVDGQIIKKEYEFAVLSNIALLVRPLVVVVSAFFIIGVFWIRLKLLELRSELESIKSLTEVKRTKEELEAEIEKTKKIVRDLDALYRDNVIDEETYLIERNTVNSKLRKMQAELEEVGKKVTREKSKDNRKVRSINKEMKSLTDRLEKLEQDYSKNKIRKSFYTKEKKDIEKRIEKMQKELVGNKPLFDEIKRMLQNRKLMISGLQKIKRAYEEGFLEKFAYDSSKKELSEKLKKIDTILKKKYGMLDRERERMMGSNMLLRIAMKVES